MFTDRGSGGPTYAYRSFNVDPFDVFRRFFGGRDPFAEFGGAGNFGFGHDFFGTTFAL